MHRLLFLLDPVLFLVVPLLLETFIMLKRKRYREALICTITMIIILFLSIDGFFHV